MELRYHPSYKFVPQIETAVRLLIASDFPPDAPGGGPAVVRQMLSGLPGQVFWWSCRPSVSLNSKAAPPPVSEAAHASPGKLFPQKRWTHMKALAMRTFWAPYAAHSLKQFIGKVSPDCVWAIPHDWSILPLSQILLRKDRGFSRLHTTIQDFPDAHFHAARWGYYAVSKLVRGQEKLYVESDSADATSLPMLQDLRDRTGRAGTQMLHAGLEKEDFQYLASQSTASNSEGPVRIAYAGTILVEPEFSFFTRFLERVRCHGVNLRLEFWSSHSYTTRPWFRREWMREHGHLAEAELLSHLRSCSWGFSPMSFSDQDPRYNRFSLPTKMITYLAAGLPIISLGHPESSLMKMTEDYQVGLRLTEESFSETASWAAELSLLTTKSKFMPEIIRCARDHFDAAKMRAGLWGCFNAPRPYGNSS